MKVMLADDEESIRKVVAHIVQQNGYQFCYAKNGREALQIFEQEQPDVIILDVMMPELDGFEVCSLIREVSDVPIIFLSAKGDIVDKSIGFKMGADDYLVKPFSPIELSLRLKALLRRGGINQAEIDAPKGKQGIIVIGRLRICYDSYDVYLDGQKLNLTSKEFEILGFLAKHPGKVFTRQQLLDQVWGEDYIGDHNTITVFIRKIREKIEEHPAKPTYIQTVWGVGYKFMQ